ncbi:hypothetical protein AAFN87_09810 [Solibacillus sp. CAU 1738]
MYSNNVSLLNNITAQVKWKMVTYSNILTTFVFVQIIFSFLSSHSGMSGSGINNMELREYFYSLDSVMMVSAFTAVGIGITLAASQLVKENFSIPTTRLSANISTILFLCIANFFATVTAILTNNITLFIKMMFFDYDVVIGTIFPSMTTFFTLYMILLFASAVGYFIGSFIKVSKVLTVILAIIVFTLFIRVIPLERNFFLWLLDHSYSVFMFKAFITSFLLYSIACIVTNRQEVRR